jgi:precorrin-2/cobalt-factor-2 C20-methyltransferase
MNRPEVKTSFAAVGLGTGSPRKTSREALDVLRNSDAVYCPRSRAGNFSHARRFLDRLDSLSAEVVEYPLAMQKGGDSLRQDYRQAAREIGDALARDRRVAAVTVGDPSIYSTLGPLVETLTEIFPSVTVRTVPGISSIQEAVSRLNRPLVQGDEQFALIPLQESTELSDSLFNRFASLAFTKANRAFENLRSRLEKVERSESSYLFERLGTEEEEIRVVSETEGKAPPYFSLVLSFGGSDRWD